MPEVSIFVVVDGLPYQLYLLENINGEIIGTIFSMGKTSEGLILQSEKVSFNNDISFVALGSRTHPRLTPFLAIGCCDHSLSLTCFSGWLSGDLIKSIPIFEN